MVGKRTLSDLSTSEKMHLLPPLLGVGSGCTMLVVDDSVWMQTDLLVEGPTNGTTVCTALC